jgi:hypothetical protein
MGITLVLLGPKSIEREYFFVVIMCIVLSLRYPVKIYTGRNSLRDEDET